MGSVPVGRSSRGAALQVRDPGPAGWVSVAQLRTITPSGKRTEIIDQTNLLTPDNFKRKLAVSVDAGSVSYEGVLNPSESTLSLLSDMQDALTLADFRIVLPTDPGLFFLNTIQATADAHILGTRPNPYFIGYQYGDAGDLVLDPGGHVQQTMYSFTAADYSLRAGVGWNHSGGYTNDAGNPNAWQDLGLPNGSYPVRLQVLPAPTGLGGADPHLVVLRNCSVPEFNGGPFLVSAAGPDVSGGGWQVFYLQPADATFATFNDGVTAIDVYRLRAPTMYSFQGYVAEHMAAKLAIGKLCTFAGKIEISGAITTSLGDPWSGGGEVSPGIPGLGGGSGSVVSGWLAPVWTSYIASGSVPATVQAIKATGGTLGIALDLTAGATYLIVKVDSGPGPITLTYGGATIYQLLNPNQFVLLSWDGSEFLEIGAN